MHCLPHLFMSELWVLRRVGITGISLQPSVFRLHVVLIDFSPSLSKCTINQYSNKSSFILEKYSFQLSGHEVLVLSMWSRGRHKALVCILPWALSAQHGRHDCTSPSLHNNDSYTQRTIGYMLNASTSQG